MTYCQNFPQSSKANMWQRHSQCISVCTRALWCNHDLWLRLTTHGISSTPTCLIQLALPLFNSVLSLFLWLCQSKSPSAAPPEAGHCLQTSTPLTALGHYAEHSSGGKTDRECCLKQQRLPTHCFLIRDQHTADPWHSPLTPVWVWVYVCVAPGDSEQCENELLTAV